MRKIELPKFWFRKPDQIDATIMENFPYACELSRENLGDHQAIIEELLQSCDKENVSWRGPTFYFKNESDAIMFRLRWS